MLVAEPGHTRLEFTDGLDLEALVALARSAGDDAVQRRAAGALRTSSTRRSSDDSQAPIDSLSRRARSGNARTAARSISTLAIIAVVLAGVVVPALSEETTRLRVGVTGETPSALTVALRDGARADDAWLELKSYASVAAGEAAVRAGKAGVLIVDGQRLVWKSDPDVGLAAVVTAALQRIRAGERRRARTQRGPRQRPCSRRALGDAPSGGLDPDRDSREAIAFVGFVLLMVILWYGGGRGGGGRPGEGQPRHGAAAVPSPPA